MQSIFKICSRDMIDCGILIFGINKIKTTPNPILINSHSSLTYFVSCFRKNDFYCVNKKT